MSNFVLASPYDAGSFSQAGATAAGLGTANLVEDRPRIVTRFTSLTDAGATYDFGASRPTDLVASLGWLGYTNMSPYRNQIRYPRKINDATWSKSNVTATYGAPFSMPSPHQDIEASSTGIAFISQTIDSWFSGHTGSGVLAEYLAHGTLGDNVMKWCVSGYVFPLDSSCYWVRFYLRDNTATSVFLGVDVCVTADSPYAVGDVLASTGTGPQADNIVVGSEAVEGVPNCYRVWATGEMDADNEIDAGDLQFRVQLLDSGRNTSVLSGRTATIDGMLVEFDCDEPTGFVDNVAVRGPVVRWMYHPVTTAWSTRSSMRWYQTVHGCQSSISSIASAIDVHSLSLSEKTQYGSYGIGQRYARFVVDDPDNASGQIDLGRFFAADPVQPKINLSYGVEIYTQERSTRRTTGYGFQSRIVRPRLRMASFTHTGEEADALKLHGVYASRGSSSPVLLVKDPDSGRVHFETVYGYLEELRRAHSSFELHTTRGSVVEAEETRL